MLGYQLAWTHRRRLLAVQLPVVSVLLCGSLLLDLVAGRDHMVLVDGAIGFDDGNTWHAGVKLTLTALCLLTAVAAGALALTGHDRPVRGAVRQLPRLVAGLALAAVVAFALVWGLRNVVGFVGCLAVLALGSARMLAGVVTRNPHWKAVGSVLLGGYAAALLLSYVAEQALTPGTPALLAGVVDAVLLIFTAALHAGVIAAQADPAPVGKPSRVLWVAAAAVVLPVLLTSGVAVANPYDAPVISTTEGAAAGAIAAAWPAGQHPIIVTTGGVRFCDTDRCDRFTGHTGGPPAVDGYAKAGIGPDGSVVKAAITGGTDTGGPFVHFARCTRAAGCREGWVPVRVNAREKIDLTLGRIEFAASAGPDGSFWIFLAVPASADRFRLLLIRCADDACGKPERHEAGSMSRHEDGYRDGWRARLSVGGDGRPVASLWSGHGVHQVSCEPVTCARPRTAELAGAPPDAIWATPEVLGAGIAALKPGRLQIEHWEPLENHVAAESGAVALAGDAVYVAEAVVSSQQRGVSVSFGSASAGGEGEYWRQVLWRCTRQRECRRTPLDVYPGPAHRELLAPGPDGRVLIVRQDRILLVEP
ncbi:hypothetical protein [Actinoplanes aureus]|uniref:Uncharacterized protein n=1 Tax=Actinoplanes aureus TaxID=2792083 RepID=A0A931CEG9_9ACTN|nr:hypothetical protein [Actinoplanes aureus]MBG0565987.1 hypothetical protein [Actinoplanes aureus]